MYNALKKKLYLFDDNPITTNAVSLSLFKLVILTTIFPTYDHSNKLAILPGFTLFYYDYCPGPLLHYIKYTITFLIK